MKKKWIALLVAVGLVLGIGFYSMYNHLQRRSEGLALLQDGMMMMCAASVVSVIRYDVPSSKKIFERGSKSGASFVVVSTELDPRILELTPAFTGKRDHLKPLIDSEEKQQQTRAVLELLEKSAPETMQHCERFRQVAEKCEPLFSTKSANERRICFMRGVKESSEKLYTHLSRNLTRP